MKQRFAPDAGIAIGPILFVLAMLGLLASVFSAGSGGSLGTASISDRVTADLVSQANLIRTKITECHMQYLVNGTNNSSAPCAGDPYPCSDQTDGTLASALTCPNDPLTGGGAEQSLWMGLRVASYPPPTKGFGEWMYINAGEAGGRCIWTAPISGKGNTGNVDGIKKATAKFTSQEMAYDPTSNSQKLVIFITRPSGAADAHCTVP